MKTPNLRPNASWICGLPSLFTADHHATIPSTDAASRKALQQVDATEAYLRERRAKMPPLPRAEDFIYDQADADERLLPFGYSPVFASLTRPVRHAVLTGANLQFCEATISYEVGLLNDTLHALIALGCADNPQELFQHLASEEAEHATMSAHQVAVTRAARRYYIQIPDTYYAHHYRGRVGRVRGVRRHLCAVAHAALLEADQTSLHLLATSSASPWQVRFHEAHWIDEHRHSDFFLRTVKVVYGAMDGRGRRVFVEELGHAARAISTFDHNVWHSIVVAAGVSEAVTTEMLGGHGSTAAPAGLALIADELNLPLQAFGY